ncbi:MAG TPA: ketosteroid isomerase, partial [Blastocatellia bacterium]
RVFGHDGVRDYWARQWTVINPRVEPVGFETAPDGRTVVRVHQVIRDLEGHVRIDRIVEHVYAMEAGLIKSMEIREI